MVVSRRIFPPQLDGDVVIGQRTIEIALGLSGNSTIISDLKIPWTNLKCTVEIGERAIEIARGHFDQPTIAVWRRIVRIELDRVIVIGQCSGEISFFLFGDPAIAKVARSGLRNRAGRRQSDAGGNQNQFECSSSY